MKREELLQKQIKVKKIALIVIMIIIIIIIKVIIMICMMSLVIMIMIMALVVLYDHDNCVYGHEDVIVGVYNESKLVWSEPVNLKANSYIWQKKSQRC